MAGTDTMPDVTISPKGEDRIRSGHPWVYRSDLAEVNAGRGEVVLVKGRRKAPLGHALYSDRSEIALRLLTRGHEAPTLETWRAWMDAAISYRESLGIDATAYRLIHGEADRLPGLVVDRYGDYLVLQALVQGVDRLLPDLTRLLVERVQPAGILARNDPRVRLLEGLEQTVTVLHGTVPEGHRDSRRAGPVCRRSVPRPEDRVVPRPAREPRGRRRLRQRPGPRCLQLQRGLCSGLGARVQRSDCRRYLG